MTPLFDDWKRFYFVLREIAGGQGGRPMSGFDAQNRARAALIECGYAWPGQALQGRMQPAASVGARASGHHEDRSRDATVLQHKKRDADR
jgi:hypothetical protein